MILFAFPAYEKMATVLEPMACLQHGDFVVDRFSNGEMHAEVQTPVRGKVCAVLGSIAPPDEAMLAMLLLCHTLAKEGAARVIVLLPYLGYARHDREEPGKSLGVAWAGTLLEAAGADEVVAVDVHSREDETLFTVPLHSLSPASMLAGEIRRLGWNEATIVAPDEGAQERCEAVRRALGQARPIAYFQKQRTPEGVRHLALHGTVGERAVIVDDILDTGGTLVSCSEALRDAGVREILILVTHGLFTGAGWQRLRSLGVTEIACTDTVPICSASISIPLSVLSVAPLLGEYLQRDSRFPQEEHS